MNRIKLSFSKPLYIIEDKKVVKCEVNANLGFPFNDMNFTGIGIASPIDGDTFDELTGRRVARAKAELEVYKNVRKFFKSQIRNLTNAINDMSICTTDMTSYIEHNKEYLNKF